MRQANRAVNIGALVREALAGARSQPVASCFTITIVALMMVTVMLTAGRTVSAQETVLRTIDSAGTRSIVVTATDGAELTSGVIDRLSGLQDIEWAGAFSEVFDVENSEIPGGARVPSRFLYTMNGTPLGISSIDFSATNGIAYGTDAALLELGMREGGGISTAANAGYGVRGGLLVPSNLSGLNLQVVIPQARSPEHGVNLLVVLARDAKMVASVSAAVESVLGVRDPTRVQVTTSEQLANIRSLVATDFTAFSRNLVLGALAISGFLVAITLSALVLIRRKDFGRRRALGASKAIIMILMLLQTAILATIGASIGSLVAVAVPAFLNDALPDAGYLLSVAILAILISIIAATGPALIASQRDPYRELRVA